MSGGTEHLLLTRFNVPHADWRRDRRSAEVRSEAWLEHRFELFERFCVPSVRAQTQREFRWLVFFAADTPKRFLLRAEACAKRAPFELQVASEFAELVPRVAAALRPGSRALLTTRLDNDDALHRDALARLRAASAQCREREWLNLPQGYLCRADAGRAAGVYAWRHESNPFVSLFEPLAAEPPRTAWCVSHAELERVAKVRQLEGAPAWLCLVHQRNLRNALPAPRRLARLRRWLARGAGRRDGSAPEPTPLALADVAGDFGLAL